MTNFTRTCIQLLIVALSSDIVLHRCGLLPSIITALVLGFLVVLVSDFYRLTNGTLRWRWRTFNFKDEFTNRYYYTESLYLGIVVIPCNLLVDNIVNLLK